MIAVSERFSTDCRSMWIYPAPKGKRKCTPMGKGTCHGKCLDYMRGHAPPSRRRAYPEVPPRAYNCDRMAYGECAKDRNRPRRIRFQEIAAYKAVRKPTQVHWYRLLRRVSEPC